MKDIDFRWIPNPLTGDIVTVKNEKSISQSLRSIMLTAIEERRLKPSFGVGVNQLLFENLDTFSIDFLKKRVLSNIDKFEKRISVLNLEFNLNGTDNSLFITLTYKLKSGGTPQTFTLERIL